MPTNLNFSYEIILRIYNQPWLRKSTNQKILIGLVEFERINFRTILKKIKVNFNIQTSQFVGYGTCLI